MSEAAKRRGPIALARAGLNHLRRACAWDLQFTVVSERERAQLLAAGVTQLTLHRYAVWRRSVLFVVLVPTLLAAVLATVDTVDEEHAPLSDFGWFLTLLGTLVIWALPVAALLAIRSWAALRNSHRFLIAGWVAAFLPPFLIALVPLGWWFSGAETPEQRQELALLDVANGLYVAFTLLPTALAVLPGVVRACLRVKTLLPAALLPGWFLVVAPPFYLLLAIVALIVMNHMAGSPLLILGVVLWIGAPMIYVWRADLFVRPLTVEECPAIDRVQWLASLLGLSGFALLLAYLFTKQVAGLHLVGLDAGTSLIWMWENRAELPFPATEILPRARALYWVGDISLSQLFVQYFGRSLFMTTVFADILVRMSLSIWAQEKRFAATPAAAEYDATMADLHRALSPDQAGEWGESAR